MWSPTTNELRFEQSEVLRKFYWVRDPAKKQQLVHFCLDQPAAAKAHELIVRGARLDSWKRYRDLMLECFEKSTATVPKAGLWYYRKIVSLVYVQGPFYLMSPIQLQSLDFLAIYGRTRTFSP